jgi:pilus assembly protein CpaB
MASRKITLLLAAAVLALGTVFVLRQMMTPEVVATEQPKAVVETTEIAVAARDLPTGTILKESDLRWQEWAANADTNAMIVKGKANLESFAGAVVRDGFHAGDPILSARVAHAHDQGFLAAVLTPGMRAMSIALSPTAEVAGFVFPGDRVDVILTHSFSRKDVSDLTERRVSETVLKNVRVLALDQRSDNQVTDPKVAQIATLEVSPKDAERLALAIDLAAGQSGNKASLMLVLRSLAIDDTPQADGKPAAADDDKQGPTWDSDVSRSFPTVNGDDSLIDRVQVMRGKTTTETTFERHR